MILREWRSPDTITSSNFYSAALHQKRRDKEMIMHMSLPQKIIVLCIVVLLPSHSVMAGSFSDILRVMGISVAPSGVRGTATILQGNLWLSKIDGTGAYRPKPITRDGTYHSPLWIPGSSQILAIKGNK